MHEHMGSLRMKTLVLCSGRWCPRTMECALFIGHFNEPIGERVINVKQYAAPNGACTEFVRIEEKKK